MIDQYFAFRHLAGGEPPARPRVYGLLGKVGPGLFKFFDTMKGTGDEHERQRIRKFPARLCRGY